MNNKQALLIAILVTLIVAAGAGTVFYSNHKLSQSQVPKEQATEENKPNAAVYSLNGTITAVEPTSITLLLADNKTEKIFLISHHTVVTKVSADGSSKVPDKFSSIKEGTKVYIYSSSDISTPAPPQLSEITIATK